jgi:hypothetical protein
MAPPVMFPGIITAVSVKAVTILPHIAGNLIKKAEDKYS